MIGGSSELFSLGNEEARRETIKLRSEKLNLIVINYKVGKPGEQHTGSAGTAWHTAGRSLLRKIAEPGNERILGLHLAVTFWDAHFLF